MPASKKRSKKNFKRLSSPNQLRCLQLSTNVNDYDTGETETPPEKDRKTVTSSVISKKTGDKFRDLEK
jgi:hypothetical protein